MFKALASRNFRLYYISQGVSFTGNLIQEVALSWLMYQLTGEALYVGLLFFMKQISGFFLSPLAGVLSDKLKKQTLMLITNSLLMLMAFLMAAFVLMDFHVVTAILAVQFINGIISGIDLPVRQAFVKELVTDDSQLINAIALNSSLFNIARIVSPLLAGLLIPLVGEGVCFLINGVTFSTVIGGLLMMRDIRHIPGKDKIQFVQDVIEGLGYVRHHPVLRKVMMVTAGISLFGLPFTILLPIFTKQILNGDVKVMGLLTTAIGVGSLISALYMASKRNAAGLPLVICLASVLYGCGIIFFSQAGVLTLAVLALAHVGMGQVLIFSSCNSIIQTVSNPLMTGRVLSLYIMTFLGMSTIGALAIGALADEIGAVPTLMISGCGCLATAFYLLFSGRILKLRLLAKLKELTAGRRVVVKNALTE